METRRRDARLRERRPAHAPAGHRELLGARPALAGGARLVLARGRRRPRARVQPPVGLGLRRLAGARVDDVVQRRHGLDRPELRPPLGGARARQDRRGLRRRGRLAPGAHVRRTLTGRRPPRRGPDAARRRAGRPRCDLPAHVPRGRDRLPRLRAPRRSAGAALLGLRGSGGRAEAAGLGSEGRDHG